MVKLVTAMTMTVTTMTLMSVYVLIFLACHVFLCYHAIFFCVLRNALSSSVWWRCYTCLAFIDTDTCSGFFWGCGTIHSTYTFLSCREISGIKMALVFCFDLQVLQTPDSPAGTFKRCIRICEMNRGTDCKLLKNL